jgi:AcrR family transcriptional regulator
MAIISKRLPADERKAVIVATVVELAAEQNPGEITTTAIARQMDLTQGALFRHFPCKDAIWQAVMEWVAEDLLGRVEQSAQKAATPLAALEAIFAAHLDFIITYPGVPRILFYELQRAEDTAAKRMVRTLFKQYSERLIILLEEGKAQGELATQINVAAAAALFLGMIQGLVMQSLIAGEPGNIGTKAQEVFTLYRRSIRSIA